MNNVFYNIYHCNQWHEYASFRFICLVDVDHLNEALAKIQKEQGYTEEDMTDYIHVDSVTLNDF